MFFVYDNHAQLQYVKMTLTWLLNKLQTLKVTQKYQRVLQYYSRSLIGCACWGKGKLHSWYDQFDVWYLLKGFISNIRMKIWQ